MAKSNPIGVRFDEVKTEAIKKHYNLKTNQRLLDFLVDEVYLQIAPQNKAIIAPKIKETTKEPLPVTRNQPQALKMANTALSESLDNPKMSENERKDILRQIEEVKARKCPSYMNIYKFRNLKEKELVELENKLK